MLDAFLLQFGEYRASSPPAETQMIERVECSRCGKQFTVPTWLGKPRCREYGAELHGRSGGWQRKESLGVVATDIRPARDNQP